MSVNPFENAGTEPTSEEELRALVEKFNAATKAALDSRDELDSVSSYLQEQEAELLKEQQRIRAEKNEIERQKSDLARKAREAQKELADHQRRLNTFLSEKAVREKMAAEQAEIDSRTINSFWRRFAFPHQIDGASRMAVAKRALLGDQTGLGKTVTSIIWADMVEAKRVIVITPKDVLRNFEREFKKWDPERSTLVAQGMNKTTRDQFFGMLRHADKFTILINYEAWRRDDDLVEALIKLQADTIICDESHIMREGTTKSALGVKKIVYAENQCNVCGGDPEVATENHLTGQKIMRCSVCFSKPENFGDFCSVKNLLLMTATSVVNKPQDLYPLLHLIDRENFYSLNNFLQDYCKQDFYDGTWRFKSGGEAALLQRLGTRVVSRSAKSIGVKMPDQINIPHVLEFEGNLYKKQRDAIQVIRRMALDMLGAMGKEKIEIPAVIAQYMRLRQAITWPAGIKIHDTETNALLYQCDVEESIIMDKAEDIIVNATREGDRVVVFSQFKEVLKEAERRLKEKNITCIRLDGDTSDVTRNQIAIDFDSKTAEDNPDMLKPWDPVENPNGYKWQVVLAHYRVGGVGLNLDLARQVVMVDRSWNFATETQAINRTRRLNTKHDSVVVHTIHVQHSITTWLDSIIQYKTEMAEGLDQSMDMAESFIQALRDDFK